MVVSLDPWVLSGGAQQQYKGQQEQAGAEEVSCEHYGKHLYLKGCRAWEPRRVVDSPLEILKYQPGCFLVQPTVGDLLSRELDWVTARGPFRPL